MPSETDPTIEPTAVRRAGPRAEPTVPAERIALVDLLDRCWRAGWS
jgi:hypothetical protein